MAPSVKAPAEPLASERVVTGVRQFLEAYMGRRARDAEVAIVTEDLLKSGTSPRCEEQCERGLSALDVVTKVMNRERSTPDDLYFRSTLLAAIHFAEPPVTPRLRELFASPDPPAVILPKYKSILTRRDVVAMINLSIFGNGASPPRTHQVSAAEVKRMTAEVREPILRIGTFPTYGVFAAELWLAIEQQWPALTPRERNVVRAYAGGGPVKAMPAALYARLFGGPPALGESLRKLDVSYAAAMTAPSKAFMDKVDVSLRAIEVMRVINEIGKTVP